jgi:hypothetical protein
MTRRRRKRRIWAFGVSWKHAADWDSSVVWMMQTMLVGTNVDKTMTLMPNFCSDELKQMTKLPVDANGQKTDFWES